MDFWMIWDLIPRRVRQWILFIIGLIALPGLPILGVVGGGDCERWNIEGLSQSQGITPEMARDMTWNWSQIGLWIGLVLGVIFFFVGLIYFVTPEKKRSVWR